MKLTPDRIAWLKAQIERLETRTTPFARKSHGVYKPILVHKSPNGTTIRTEVLGRGRDTGRRERGNVFPHRDEAVDYAQLIINLRIEDHRKWLSENE